MRSRKWVLFTRCALALALVAGGGPFAQAQDVAATHTLGALNAALPRVGGSSGPGVALALQVNLTKPASVSILTPAVPPPAPSVPLNGPRSSFGAGTGSGNANNRESASGYWVGIRSVSSRREQDIGWSRPVLWGKESSNGQDREVEVIAIPVSTSTAALSRSAQNNSGEAGTRAEAQPKEATSTAAALVAGTPGNMAIGN